MRVWLLATLLVVFQLTTTETQSPTFSGFDSLIRDSVSEYFPDQPDAFYWIKAKMFAESAFQSNAKSWVGALGLMQIMPGTARDLGGNQALSLDPNWAVSAGTRYTRTMWRYFPHAANQRHRRAFSDASYNSGAGNVLKAARKAEREGKDPTLWWDNVRETLVTRPAHQKETRNYVDRIQHWTKEIAVRQPNPFPTPEPVEEPEVIETVETSAPAVPKELTWIDKLKALLSKLAFWR